MDELGMSKKLSLESLSTNKKTPLIEIYMTGVIAACCAECVAYPFDVCKTRMQLQGEMAIKAREAVKYRGMFATGLGIAKEEGIFKLYGGLSAMVLRHSVFSGLKMVFYDFFRDKLVIYDSNGQPQLTFFRGSLCGLLGGVCANIISSPTDLIKVQMQMEGKRRLMGEQPRIHNVFQALTSIYSTGGVRGLWKGTMPNTWRAALVTVGDVSFYDLSKRTLMNVLNTPDTRLLQFACAMIAGFFAAVLSSPADVMKSRIMNQPTDEVGRGLHYKNSIDCFNKLLKQEGFMALYKGFMPYWLRIGPWSIVFWMSFEQIRRFCGDEGY